MDSISGSVERITYYNPENGYSVVRLKPDAALPRARLSRDGLVTITGNLPELSPGEHLALCGDWSHHATYGAQFQVQVCEQTLPATAAGIRKYLGSGLIRGIGPRLAERIVACFGLQTLEVIENTPERLQAVPDIGPVRTRAIAQAWDEQKQVKEIMLFLHSYAVSTNLAVKIYKKYGDLALQIVKNDPYQLARDIYGVGFKTADRIAQAMGLPVDHPSRIEAGVVYVLNEMSDEGHVYAPQAELIEKAAALLGVDPALLPPALERLRAAGRTCEELVPERKPQAVSAGVREASGGYQLPAVYLAPFYASEKGVAERLRTLREVRSGVVKSVSYSKPKPAAPAQAGLALSDEQQQAIRLALVEPLSILTGGPGTGKTTCLKALIEALDASGQKYALASPTGRAAKRLAEATGRPASTIHRLLGYKPGEGFKFSAENPLPVHQLVVDETSMLDLILAHQLLKALRPGTRLLFVGDADQLPSVGAGDFLRDLIASGSAPVTALSVIFRQAAGSQIITNAHRINSGKLPVFSNELQAGEKKGPGDFFLFPADTPEEAAEWVLKVVCERIPQAFGIEPNQIQVLAPMYRGAAGVNALNEHLQASLNPPDPRKAEKALFGQIYRAGDRVMQTRNNYDKDVYNGDIGTVRSVNLIEHTLAVDHEGKVVVYDWSEADELTLAYAASVHKAQGSEFPAVVMPLVTQHYLMLQRNLLYTGVTRARQLCVLAGSRKAIAMAVRNNKVAERYTALDWRLSGE